MSLFNKKKSYHTDSIVPKGNIIGFPLVSHLEIGILCDLSKEVLKDIVRLGFGYSDDAASKPYVKMKLRKVQSMISGERTRIHVYALPTCHRVYSYDYHMISDLY